ncbi:ninjurin-2-like [Ptychodera flava]|uniref:ninjurin-2-like n=1 Tax=Ptychodera flava TaxID=63121 RepID=UPI003969CA9F
MDGSESKREMEYLLDGVKKQSPTTVTESPGKELVTETRETTPSGGEVISTGAVHNGPKKNVVSVNTYATKKTICQGLLDVSLLASNAVVLRFVIITDTPYSTVYYLLLSLIGISICLQFVVAVFLFCKITVPSMWTMRTRGRGLISITTLPHSSSCC